MWLALFVLVMFALVILGVAIPQWPLLALAPLVVLVQSRVHGPAPDDDVEGPLFWVWFIPYAVALVIGILAGKLIQEPGDPV